MSFVELFDAEFRARPAGAPGTGAGTDGAPGADGVAGDDGAAGASGAARPRLLSTFPTEPVAALKRVGNTRLSRPVTLRIGALGVASRGDITITLVSALSPCVTGALWDGRLVATRSVATDPVVTVPRTGTTAVVAVGASEVAAEVPVT